MYLNEAEWLMLVTFIAAVIFSFVVVMM